MFRIGYFHGRFQPFHLGHLSVVKYALARSDLLAMGISNPFRLQPVIDSAFSENEAASMLTPRLPENNPWPYWARVLMIREGIISEGVDISRVLFIPHLLNTGLPVDEVRFPRDITSVFLCPKDAHNRAVARMYQEEGWEVVEVPVFEFKGIKDARAVRKMMALGQEWRSFVPVGTAKVIDWLSSREDVTTK